MKNKGNIGNIVLNIPSAQDPSAFHPDEDAKHKYISDSDDDQKGNQKQGKQGQKRKAKTKDAAPEDNVKKTKQGSGKGRGKTSMCPTFKCSQFQPGSARTGYIYTDFQPVRARTGHIYTDFSQEVQGQTGQNSPYGPQVPDAYEAEIFNNEVPTVILYHKSMHLCYPEKCSKEWNPRFMRHLHNMFFRMKTFRRYYSK